MTYYISMSLEELDEVGMLLSRELSTDRAELRRTRNPQFRDQVRRKIDLREHVLDTIRYARTERTAEI